MKREFCSRCARLRVERALCARLMNARRSARSTRDIKGGSPWLVRPRDSHRTRGKEFTVLRKLWVLMLLSVVTPGRAEPIRVHPDNPHYYSFRGKPTVLVTSAEHYGAVINRAFDYNAYLDALKSYGLNYTRIYPAAFIEPEGTFHPDNTLAPKSEDLIQPWARS